MSTSCRLSLFLIALVTLASASLYSYDAVVLDQRLTYPGCDLNVVTDPWDELVDPELGPCWTIFQRCPDSVPSGTGIFVELKITGFAFGNACLPLDSAEYDSIIVMLDSTVVGGVARHPVARNLAGWAYCYRIGLPEISPGDFTITSQIIRWTDGNRYVLDSWVSYETAYADCQLNVSFAPNCLPRTYEFAGPAGPEHRIELRNSNLPQAVQIGFEIPTACFPDAVPPVHIELAPRSGTGQVTDLILRQITDSTASYSCYFIITNLTAPGYYDLEATYADQSTEIFAADINYIGYAGYVSRGSVYNEITGNVIRGAEVSIWQSDGQGGYQLFDGMVASDGTYSFDVPPGIYKILVSVDPGGQQWRGPFEVGVRNLIPYEDIYLQPNVDDTLGPIFDLTVDLVEGFFEATGLFRDSGVGLAVVEIDPASTINAAVAIDEFSSGVLEVGFHAWSLDSTLPGIAVIRSIDLLGNLTECVANLEPSCCTGLRGNLDDSPDDVPTLGDLTVMIDHLFISLSPLFCWEEGNLDGSLPEGDGSVTLGDLTVLIDNLFISLNQLLPCP